jgi:hypothetical protein
VIHCLTSAIYCNREEYCILDGRTSRLWFFPLTADTFTSGSNFKELGLSGLGVPSYILLLNGCNTRAQEAVTVSTHRSDPTSFTVTITDDWIPNASGAGTNRLYSDQRSYTFRANTAEKAGKWVSRLSSLHGMLHQPLLPPGPHNPRLYKPVIADFVQTYSEGNCTYLSAAEKAFAKQSGAVTAITGNATGASPGADDSGGSPTASAYASGGHFHHSVTTTLASCGGGGSADADTDSSPHSAPIPHTARCASHWAGNCMFESIEDCIATTQQGNTQRDQDLLESLMTFEGMLKNKYECLARHD